jgi:hypothetical protein
MKNCKDVGDLLRIVPHANGFHFYIALGDYCGVTAHSLEEFADAIQYVCSEAILFHFERGDFQNWIRDVIGDNKLAQRIDSIKMCERHLSAEYCRKILVDEVRIRILQLETPENFPCFDKKEENSSTVSKDS